MMMTPSFRLISSACLFLIIITLPKNGATYIDPWISISGTMSNFSQLDFNQEFTGSPTQDVSLGVSCGLDFHNRWITSLNYDLFPPNKKSALEMSIYLLTAGLEYQQPLTSTTRLGAGGEVGLISVSGLTHRSYAFQELPFFFNGVNGKGPTLKVFSIVQWQCFSWFAIISKVGYRFSRVGRLESNSGNTIFSDDGNFIEADCSGWSFGMGLRLYP